MLKFSIGFVVLGAVFAYTKQVNYKNADKSPIPFNEIPCLTVGGTCVMACDCPAGQLAETSGLCPEQQLAGLECCYGLSKSETRCGRRGGQCVPRTEQCPDNLTFNAATDCEADEKCCILVK